ncbi:hypothetical protein F7734_15010 [Scytonema sp. UIC 10036]|uniref:hypothetical protein n=1 Tax=Scytonema sp. UIC 10036 TaxID=2304196 RepID=UPI0012DA4836|nr:hypothetical protein [Scytonema sp. UIC 10036]MUG93657.1 hypothetical protein [Scytonema sp. UIC 10036]
MPLSIFVPILLGFSSTTCTQSKLRFPNNDWQKQIVFQETFEPPGDGEPKDTAGAGSRKGLSCFPNEQSMKTLIRWQRICTQKLTALKFINDSANG